MDNGDHKADAFAYRRGPLLLTAIEDIIDYVENPEKTDYGKLIYGFECDTRTADAEFTLAKRQYINLEKSR